MNIEAIAAAYAADLKHGTDADFRALLALIDQDKDVTDPRWAAYMLATAQWETARTFRAVEEIDRGAGRSYGDPVTVVIDGKSYTNTYYGRGLVQLTWRGNYATMSHALGMGNLLVTNPEKALELPTAYEIMSFGMRHGSFTGVGLDHFIHDDVADYASARKIINGIDHAATIATVARRFEELLKL